MFDLSFAELLVVTVVGLIVIGPKDLPKVARYIRNIIRSVHQTTAEIRKQVDDALDAEEIKETQHMIEGDDGVLYESYDISQLLDDETSRDERTPEQ